MKKEKKYYKIVSLLGRKLRAMNSEIERNLAANDIKGVVTSHGDIMLNLFRHGPMTMKELSERISRDKSTVTGLINKLILFGYIEKEQSVEDNRVYYISLTESGKKLEPIFSSISKELISKIFRNFNEDEKEQLITLLEKIDL